MRMSEPLTSTAFGALVLVVLPITRAVRRAAQSASVASTARADSSSNAA